MVKTMSVCTKHKEGYWVTNWHKYDKHNDIDWELVESFCKERGLVGYGYMTGHKSNELTSERNRTVIKEW